jgi:aminocarboxymuconate-semialdehyde decarboxylase
LVFVHGGGYIPYQETRFSHGHAQRQEGRVTIGDDALTAYFDMVYYDIITHDNDALEYLIKKQGSKKILLGTDYPFDMQEYRPVDRIKSLAVLSDAEKEDIMGKNTLEQLLNGAL